MTTTQCQYLEKRPHPWRQQLYLKGKRIKASVIWGVGLFLVIAVCPV